MSVSCLAELNGRALLPVAARGNETVVAAATAGLLSTRPISSRSGRNRYGLSAARIWTPSAMRWPLRLRWQIASLITPMCTQVLTSSKKTYTDVQPGCCKASSALRNTSMISRSVVPPWTSNDNRVTPIHLHIKLNNIVLPHPHSPSRITGTLHRVR